MFRKYIKNDDFLTSDVFTDYKYEELITNVHNVLVSLDYVGRVTTIQKFQCIFTEGAMNKWFYDIASWLCYKLGTKLRVEGHISVDSQEILRAAFMEETLKNPRAFLIEMSSLLYELKCPLKQLTSGLIDERLKLVQNQLLIIDYLIDELQKAKTKTGEKAKVMKEIEVVELEESRTATELRVLFLALKFSRPPNDLNAAMVFSKIDKQLCSLSQPLLPENLLQEALLSGALNESLWYSLERLYGEFYDEYSSRREMDMTRASAIIYSFMWNERVEDRQDISGDENTASGGSEKVASDIPNELRGKASVDLDAQISDVIAATAEISLEEKASSGAVFQIPRFAVYGATFDQVPDQRGQPYEQMLPPPDIPSWQLNRGSSHFTMSSLSGPARPVKVVAPLSVDGDNFPQFGNVPLVIGQPGLRGAPVRMNQDVPVAPVPGGNFQYQHGWGVPQGGLSPIGGHGGHNADYSLFGGHANDNVSQGLFGGRGQYDNPVQDEGPPSDQGRGDHIQDGGQQVRRVQFSGDHSYLEGFGGFRSHGGSNRGFGF